MGTYETTMLKLERMAQSNTAQGQKWQKEMSDTSHQREVKDLIAAGLNPVLSSNQGAQSYTTQVDSAVNGIAGMASAREGANATRYAARQSAAATRAAAAAQLEAARISAQASRDVATIGNKRTIPGLIDSYRSQTKSDNTGIGLTMTNLWKKVDKDPGFFFKSGEVNKNFNDLTTSGKNICQKTLRQLGISETLPNQQTVFRAIFNGEASAQKRLQAWMVAFERKANNAKKVWSSKTGSGVW